MVIKNIWGKIINELPERDREVLIRHWGLEGEEEKLAEIGRDLGLTRERIRQIKERAVKQIVKGLEKEEISGPFLNFVKERMSELGIRGENKFEKILKEEDKLPENEIKLVKKIIRVHPSIFHQEENESLRPFFSLEKEIFVSAKHALEKIKKYIAKNRLYNEDEILDIVSKEIRTHLRKKPALDELIEVLSLIKILAKNPLNHFGHIEHPLIAPDSLKGKLMAVLHHYKRPMHPNEIYQVLRELSQKDDELIPSHWKKLGDIASIRNELIRSPEFVFVGKGHYGLREWGLEEGDAKTLMFNILKKEGKMPIDILWKKISSLRDIKKTSFYIYLKSSPRVIIKDKIVIYKR